MEGLYIEVVDETVVVEFAGIVVVIKFEDFTKLNRKNILQFCALLLYKFNHLPRDVVKVIQAEAKIAFQEATAEAEVLLPGGPEDDDLDFQGNLDADWHNEDVEFGIFCYEAKELAKLGGTWVRSGNDWISEEEFLETYIPCGDWSFPDNCTSDLLFTIESF